MPQRRQHVERDEDDEQRLAEFVDLAGTIVGSLLLVTPGFASDAVGFLFFVPLFRHLVGRLVTNRMRDRLKELYEYLKLYDL